MELKKVFVLVMLLMCMAGIAVAQDGQLHGAVGLTYQSRYIWRGFDVYADNHSAIEPFVSLQCPESGLGLTLLGHSAIDSDNGFGNSERWDYILHYSGAMFQDEAYAVNYRFGYMYYNYPDMPNHWFDLQELHSILSFPKILGVEGLVPSYILVKLWPANSGSLVGSGGGPGTASGFAHIFMLDYPLVVEGFLPETPQQVLRLHAEAVFNDGVSPAGPATGAVKSDWSNAVFGVATDFDLSSNLTLTPGLYYQSSWEDSVNTSDEAWFTLGMAYKF
jgi:hypothetical protein